MRLCKIKETLVATLIFLLIINNLTIPCAAQENTEEIMRESDINITVPLNVFCELNPNIYNGFSYSDNLTVENNSDYPLSLSIVSFIDNNNTFNDILPGELPLDKEWDYLGVNDSLTYFSLGIYGNENEWIDCSCTSPIYIKEINEENSIYLGTFDKGKCVNFDLKAFYGRSFKENFNLSYQITWLAELEIVEGVNTLEESIEILETPIEVPSSAVEDDLSMDVAYDTEYQEEFINSSTESVEESFVSDELQEEQIENNTEITEEVIDEDIEDTTSSDYIDNEEDSLEKEVILNIDTDNDGEADLNVDIDGDGIPDFNIDINGDEIIDEMISVEVKPFDTNDNGIVDYKITTITSYSNGKVLAYAQFETFIEEPIEESVEIPVEEVSEEVLEEETEEVIEEISNEAVEPVQELAEDVIYENDEPYSSEITDEAAHTDNALELTEDIVVSENTVLEENTIITDEEDIISE